MSSFDTGKPLAVGNESDWEMIAGGFRQTCGIRKGGSLWCWGFNAAAQVGDGTTENRFVPVRVGEPTGWIDVALADWLTCGLRTDRSLWCWGNHGNGAPLGDHKPTDTTPRRLVLRPKGTSSDQSPLTFKQYVLGDGHACALTSDGSVYCWGAPGRLGDGKEEGTRFPSHIDTSEISPPPVFKTLTAGSRHTCGMTTEGNVYCWGKNDRGQVGDGGSTEWVLKPSPVDVGAIDGSQTFAHIDTGTFHTCAIMMDGAAYCWGGNTNGALGSGDSKDQRRPVRVDTSHLSGGMKMKQISCGFGHSCAIDREGVVYCWGNNISGQLGVGTKISAYYRPEPVSTLNIEGARLFKQISTGDVHTCAITIEGRLYCWGNSNDGRLGIGAITY